MNYPSHFPCPTWQYGQSASKFMGRTPFECGWTRQRHTWPDDRTTYDLTFEMDSDMFAEWFAWMNTNGYAYFLIELDRYSGTPEVQNIRLVTEISYTYTKYNHVVCVAGAEKQNA